MQYLFLLFILMPVAEITVLIKVGGFLGLGNTVALILTTAFIGAYLIRRQGLQTLLKINQRFTAGEVPARELLEGIIIAVGGALLLTPGFITDVIGFCCVLPGSRQLLVAQLLKRTVVATMRGAADPFSQMRSGPFSQVPPQPRWDEPPVGPQSQAEPNQKSRSAAKPHRPEVIEGEYRRED
jgi:UPF0716 protein FxsA